MSLEDPHRRLPVFGWNLRLLFLEKSQKHTVFGFHTKQKMKTKKLYMGREKDLYVPDSEVIARLPYYVGRGSLFMSLFLSFSSRGTQSIGNACFFYFSSALQKCTFLPSNRDLETTRRKSIKNLVDFLRVLYREDQLL